jgi:exodeoxyribonuclease VII large subunit
MAVPVREELWLGIKQLDARLAVAIQRLLAQRHELLGGLARGLPKPVQLLQTATQRLDDWSERLHAALPASLARKEQQLALLTASLRPQILLVDIKKALEQLHELEARLFNAGKRLIDAREERLRSLISLLESVNYQRVLERGFALVKDAQGKLVTSAAQAMKKDALTVTFRDGEIKVRP